MPTAQFRAVIGAILMLFIAQPAVKAQGLYQPGAGAVQGSMGGASTASPLDAIGALYWNPAAIGQLGHNEVSIGGNILFPDIKVSSSFPGPGGTVSSGTTRSDSGVPLASSLGVVYQSEDNDRITYGLGLFTLGGGGVNFPGSPGNPVLSPTGPLGKVVLGPIESSLTLVQIDPTVSYRVTDRFVVGIGPTIDVTLASFDPAFFGRPSLNGSGQLVFPSANSSQPYWGGGFRVGATYTPIDSLDIGFGYTSPQWLQPWTFNARDLAGNPQRLTLNASLPQICSLGFGWHATDQLLLALDLRYFDYADTQLFGTSVKNGGLGWDSVFSVALGASYQVNDWLALRGGYEYNTNPLASTSTLFNIQAPAILQNTISVGTTLSLNSSISASIGYAYSFQNSITGTAEQIPGAGVRLTASNQSLLFNIAIKFGGPWSRGCGSSGEG
jgi:long-chain fatty acid transport protein